MGKVPNGVAGPDVEERRARKPLGNQSAEHPFRPGGAATEPRVGGGAWTLALAPWLALDVDTLQASGLSLARRVVDEVCRVADGEGLPPGGPAMPCSALRGRHAARTQRATANLRNIVRLFFKAERINPWTVLGCLLVASVVEGIGFASLVPLLWIVTDPAQTRDLAGDRVHPRLGRRRGAAAQRRHPGRVLRMHADRRGRCSRSWRCVTSATRSPSSRPACRRA